MWLVVEVVLGGEYLVLVYVGGDECFVIGGFVECLYYLLWFYWVVFVDFVMQFVYLMLVVDFLLLVFQVFVVWVVVMFVDYGEYFFQYLFYWFDDGNVGGDVFGDVGWVDINMDDFGVRVEFFGVVGDLVVQVCVGGQNYVGIVY